MSCRCSLSLSFSHFHCTIHFSLPLPLAFGGPTALKLFPPSAWPVMFSVSLSLSLYVSSSVCICLGAHVHARSFRLCFLPCFPLSFLVSQGRRVDMIWCSARSRVGSRVPLGSFNSGFATRSPRTPHGAWQRISDCLPTPAQASSAVPHQEPSLFFETEPWPLTLTIWP